MRPSLLLPILPLALLLDAPATQSGPPPAVQWLCGEQLTQLLDKQAAWVQLLDRSTLTIGRYRIAAGSKDGQQPHDRDEVYYVVAGKGRFTAAKETRDVGKGDLVFVAAEAPHHFHDVEEDLDLLVMFSTAVPTTGGMIAGPNPTEQTPFPESTARGSTRIFYWFGPDSAGQVAIAFGRPRWQSTYGKFLSKPTGMRWRFGENFWTTLDTNMRLTIGGVDVPVGMYYAVLQNHTDRGLELVLLDPSDVRKRRLDAYEANKTTGGITIPLQQEQAKVAASRLMLELSVDRKQKDRGQLRIRFGANVMSADVVMHPDRK